MVKRKDFRNIAAWLIQAWIRRCTGLIILIILALIFLGALYGALRQEWDRKISYRGVDDGYIIGGGDENLLVFVQVSDTHINQVNNPDRTERFIKFTNYTLKYINPQFVFHTGDIVDGRKKLGLSAAGNQYEIDWIQYKNILQATGWYNPAIWIDVRGNHDTFNVPDWNSPTNFFRTYGVWGPTLNADNYRVFQFEANVTSANYRFVFLDMTPEDGLPTLANNFGYLTTDQMNALFNQLSTATANYNHTIILAHYPRMAIPVKDRTMKGHMSLDQLARTFGWLSYLCGHVHAVDFYQIQGDGPDHTYLELEVADFKDKDYFRIMALDNDISSFIDVTQTEYPFILVTNPKDAGFMNPIEPIGRISRSQFIRTLVISPPDQPIGTISVSIDGQNIGNMRSAGSTRYPYLYILPWEPSQWSQGRHLLTTTVIDPNGNVIKSQDLEFSMDGTTRYLGNNTERLIGNISWYDLLMAIEVLAIVFTWFYLLILPRIVVKILKSRNKFADWDSKCHNMILSEDRNRATHHVAKSRVSNLFLWQFEKDVWQYSQVPRFFVVIWTVVVIFWFVGPVIIGPLYVDYTPWGAIFFWGVIINGDHREFYEIIYPTAIFLIFLHIPMLWLFGRKAYRDHHVENVVQHYQKRKGKAITMRKLLYPIIRPFKCCHTYFYGSILPLLTILWITLGFALSMYFVSDIFGVACAFVSPFSFYLYLVAYICIIVFAIQEHRFLKRAFQREKLYDHKERRAVPMVSNIKGTPPVQRSPGARHAAVV